MSVMVLNVTVIHMYSSSLTAAIDDLFEVSEAVADLSDWKSLGLTLGLHYNTLLMIERNCNHKIDECKINMLAAWLKHQDNVPHKGVPSWSVLKAALRSIGENYPAHTILENIGIYVCSSSSSCSPSPSLTCSLAVKGLPIANS